MSSREVPDGPTAVVFDLGGVLIDWDPRYLYRRLLPPEEVDPFLDEIGFAAWNHEQDAGGSWTTAVEKHSALLPHRRDLMAAYPSAVRRDAGRSDRGDRRDPATSCTTAGTRLLALTNWSRGDVPACRGDVRLPRWFEGVVVSGVEGVAKPDPVLFRLVLDRYRLDPAATVFIDDSPANVEAAAGLGLRGPALPRPRARCAETSAGSVCSTAPDQADPVAHGQHHAPRPARRRRRGR